MGPPGSRLLLVFQSQREYLAASMCMYMEVGKKRQRPARQLAYRPPFEKKSSKIYRTYTKMYTKMYPNISKLSKDIPRYKMWSLGAGPGAAAPPPLGILYSLVYLCTSWIYLDILVYILVFFGIFLGILVDIFNFPQFDST